MYLRFILGFGIICLFGNTVSDEHKALHQLSRSIGKFSNELMKSVSTDHNGNLIMSPVSAHIALAMAGYGANGKNLEQFKKVLHLDESLNKEGFQILIHQLNHIKEVTLKVANKMYISHLLEVEGKYRDLVTYSFNMEIEQVDFKGGEIVAKKINDFCAKHTNNRITHIVNKNSFTASTKMFIINALYFKAQWLWQFDPYDTMNRQFHGELETVKPVSMMSKRGDFFHGDVPDLSARFVELLYKGEELSMVVILPNAKDGLRTLIEKLDETNFNYQMIKNYGSKTELQLFLPKFKVENSLNLEEYLKGMGMTEAFASYNGFVKIARHPLQINSVKQKVFIEVQEGGTEAAAVTYEDAMDGPMPKPRAEMVVDHPFAYFIIDKRSNVSLFSGYVRLPSM